MNGDPRRLGRARPLVQPPRRKLIDLYFDFMHAWWRAVIKQCDLNIQMTVLIEENKCSHMAGLAVLSSARGHVPRAAQTHLITAQWRPGAHQHYGREKKKKNPGCF